jgi:CheY-like chemotaxis protein
MSASALNVMLIGFPAPEKATFETFFRLVSPRRPAPLAVVPSAISAHVVLWNASSEQARPIVDEKAQRLISVGIQLVPDVWRHLSRPVNLNAVLQLLDAAFAELHALGYMQPRGASTAVAAAENSRAAIPAPPPLRAAVSVPATQPQPMARAVLTPVPTPQIAPLPRRIEPTIAPPRTLPEAPQARAFESPPGNRVVEESSKVSALRPTDTAHARTPAFIAKEIVQAQSAMPHVEDTSTSPAAQTKILVVDDSDVALRFMHSRLSAFGFSVDLCASGEEALVRIADGEYSFVFLDVMMAGLDGYQTCKAIKGRRYAGGKTPTVVMLTSRGGTIDKVRGTFAGCDAYLTKPLDESKMLKVLLRYSPELADSVSTLGAPVNPQLPLQMPVAGKTIATSNPKDPLAASYENLAAGKIKLR